MEIIYLFKLIKLRLNVMQNTDKYKQKWVYIITELAVRTHIIIIYYAEAAEHIKGKQIIRFNTMPV